MSSRKIRFAVVLFLGWLPALAFAGGGDVGNGGDVVLCREAPGSPFSGYYSLDYLLTYDPTLPLVAVSSWQESLFEIRRVIVARLPELLGRFDQFQQNVLNEDFSRPEIWERTGLALVPLRDQDIGSPTRVPENCRKGEEIEILQAVVRQKREFTGSDKIVYKYVPGVFDSLNRERPLQLSFLLVHEWLWSLSDKVDRNRRISRFFHEQAFRTLDRAALVEQLQGMGLDLSEVPKTVAADGSGDFTSIDDALARAAPGATLHVKEGTYVTRGGVVDKPVHLIGLGDRAKIVIKGTESNPALTISAPETAEVEVRNLTFQRPFRNTTRPAWSEAIAIDGGRPWITECRFGVSDYVRTGIFVGGGAAPRVEKNEFAELRRGIVISDRSAGTYSGNSYKNVGYYAIELLPGAGKPELAEPPGTAIGRD